MICFRNCLNRYGHHVDAFKKECEPMVRFSIKEGNIYIKRLIWCFCIRLRRRFKFIRVWIGETWIIVLSKR